MNLLTTLVLFINFNLPPVKRTPELGVIQTVQTSLRKGNAELLSARFSKTIELVIDAENVDFSSVEATHAELILRSFFRKYPPHGFQFVYRGASDKLRYSTGLYSTDGHTFAVYILMRQAADRNYVINTLHFRKE